MLTLIFQIEYNQKNEEILPFVLYHNIIRERFGERSEKIIFCAMYGVCRYNIH